MSCGNCGSSSCGGCHICSSCNSNNCHGNCGCSCSGNYVDVPCAAATYTVNPCIASSGCGSSNPGVPTPFYAQSGQCQEDHCQTIIKNWFATCISVTYGFNIPGCGSTAILIFQDVTKLTVGTYLWHPSYGYFEVASFDFTNGQVTIVNECQDGNAAPGTFVPACTCFQVTVTPVDTAAIGASCVAIDFTAPAVGDCIDITVTNVNGLEIGGEVSIGSGIYRLEAVLTPTVVTICNDGEGITPGTPVIAKDSNSDYQYCLSVIGANPCTKDGVTDGIVLVCSDNTIFPLDGVTAGHVLTLVNPATNSAHWAATNTDCCDNIRDDIAEIVHDGCVPQILTQTVAAINYENPLSFVGVQVVEETVAAAFATFTPPSDGCNYLIVGSFNIASVINYDGGMIMAQIDVMVGGVDRGSLIWTSYQPHDGWPGLGPPAMSVNAIPSLLPTPSPEYPIMYNGGNVEVVVPVTAGGTARAFDLVFRAFVGDVAAPTATSGYKIRIAGNIRAWRI